MEASRRNAIGSGRTDECRRETTQPANDSLRHHKYSLPSLVVVVRHSAPLCLFTPRWQRQRRTDQRRTTTSAPLPLGPRPTRTSAPSRTSSRGQRRPSLSMPRMERDMKPGHRGRQTRRMRSPTSEQWLCVLGLLNVVHANRNVFVSAAT